MTARDFLPWSRILLAAGWLISLLAAGCGGGPGPLTAAPARPYFHQDMFHEQIQRLKQISPGMSETEVRSLAGTPSEERPRENGGKVFLYRLSFYQGPEPMGTWPRQVFLASETRVVFDRQGRVTAVHREP